MTDESDRLTGDDSRRAGHEPIIQRRPVRAVPRQENKPGQSWRIAASALWEVRNPGHYQMPTDPIANLVSVGF